MQNTDDTPDLAALTATLHRLTDTLVGATGTDQDSADMSDADAGQRESAAIHAAGAILTATDRLMAAVVGLLGQTTPRGVIADQGVTTSTWLRVFAARTVGDEKMLTATVDRLADMPAVAAWFADGTLSWPAVRGIIAAAVQRLACDATIRHILIDGDNVLGATATHPAVSATLRAALVVRDGGCRFPGCHAPVDRCDNHHLTPIADGGRTTLDNLALICSNHHHAIHDSGWTNTLHPDATITFTRRGVTITSQPRAAQRITSEPPPTGRPRRRRPPPTHTPPATRQRDETTAAEPADLPFETATADRRVRQHPVVPGGHARLNPSASSRANGHANIRT